MPGSNASAVEYDPQAEAVTYAGALIPNMSGMSTKGSVILIRWPVVLISASLILFRIGSGRCPWQPCLTR